MHGLSQQYLSCRFSLSVHVEDQDENQLLLIEPALQIRFFIGIIILGVKNRSYLKRLGYKIPV